ncbi:hypothetical protein C0993_010578 [Termitomyces sp. T159_Od127]|nr:hypothetical protein C0993_010578 [Termitomyces sp. T159_Od127]
MAGSRATRAVPQVVIWMPPPSKLAPVQNPPSPPDFYGMLKRAMKRDSNQVILAVLQRPLFVQAVIGLCNTVKAFPGTPADHARFLGTTGWRFADQADFPILADQKGLFNALSMILPLLNRQAGVDLGNVKAFFAFANTIVQLELNHWQAQRQRDLQEAIFPLKQRRTQADHNVDMLGLSTAHSSKQKANSDPDGKPKTKKVKVIPSVANYKTGGETALTLLGQVDAVLDAILLANGDSSIPAGDLKKHRDAVELAAQQQLHLLDLSLQTYCLISAHLERIDKALGPSEVDLTGSLLNALNSIPEESNVKLADLPEAEPKNSVDLSAAKTL